MKIIHVVETLGRGGLERVVIDLVEAQVKEGHKCSIICIFDAGELAKETLNKGISVIVCNKRKSLDLKALFKLRKIIQSEAPDIIHTHNAVPNYYVYFTIILRRSYSLINTRHGMGSKDPNSKLERHYKKTMKRTKYTVAVCEAARKKFINDGIVNSKKCVVVKNGIKVNEFTSLKAQAKKNINNKNPNNIITIGSVGRLNWAKDFYTLLDAFHILTTDFENIELLIIGGGKLERKLKKYSKEIGVDEKVTFIGDTENVKPLLPKIDIFVSSSVSEGYSIALLEACAVGIPIVATDVGGNAEIVRDNINGFVVPAKDKSALAEKLSRLIENKEMRENFAISGKEWVKEYGDVRSMRAGYDSLYQKCT